MASDIDSTGCAAIIYYLQNYAGRNYSTATQLVHEGRISVKLVAS